MPALSLPRPSRARPAHPPRAGGTPRALAGRARRAMAAAALLAAAAAPGALAAPVNVVWGACQGTLDWSTPCWTTEDGLPAGVPQAGQNAVIAARRPVEVQFNEDGSARPLNRIEVDGVSTLRQRGGTLVADRLVVGGRLWGQFDLDAGLARFGHVALGGEVAGPTSVYGVSMNVRGGRLEAHSLSMGMSQPATLNIDGGRVILTGDLDLDGQGRNAVLQLTAGRLEARQIRAGELREPSQLLLMGGTLALDEGAVTVGQLLVGALGKAATLTLADEAGDNRLRRVLADEWVVGRGSDGRLVQAGGLAAADRMTVGQGVNGQGRYEMHAGLLGARSLTVGHFGSGSVLQTGGQIGLQDELILGRDRLSEGTFELQGGQLLAETVRGDVGTSRFVQAGGFLQARTVRGLSELHLAGGQRDLTDVILSPHGLLALDDDRLSVSGHLALGGTLALQGTAPAPGQWVDLLDWGTLEGTFDSIDVSAWVVPDGHRIDFSRLYQDGQVGLWKVIGNLPPEGGALPVPASVALVLGALLGLAGSRRLRAAAQPGAGNDFATTPRSRHAAG